MAASDDILTIAYLNIRGQSGLPIVKQLQIEAFAKSNNCDIIHLKKLILSQKLFLHVILLGLHTILLKIIVQISMVQQAWSSQN